MSLPGLRNVETDVPHEHDDQAVDEFRVRIHGALARRGGWTLITPGVDGEAWQHRTHPRLRVIWSIARVDGALWIHVSASMPLRIPTHEEMALVKETFLGDRYAYAVWPPADRYVNLHPGVLHLWAREDGAPVLPEFSGVTANGTRTI